MSTLDNLLVSSIPLESVKCIKFSVLSPEDKAKLIKVFVKNFSGLEGGVAKPHSLYDTRMGTISRNVSCETCKLSEGECPGHFGGLKLALPVFNVIFIEYIKKVHACICFKCATLLLKKGDREILLKMPKEGRLSQCKKFAEPKRIRNCPRCNHPNILKFQKEKAFNLRFKKVKESSSKYKNVDPRHSLELFRKLKNEDISLIGLCPEKSRPEWMIIETLLVPSQNIRPVVFTNESNTRTEDNLFKHLVNIIKANIQLREHIEINSPESKIQEHYLNLTFTIASLFTDKAAKKNEGGFRSMGTNKPLNAIKDMYSGKKAIIRNNIVGKRVDLSSRSVISSDSNLFIDEIGVPSRIAMKLSRAIIVNQYNIKELKGYMKNGPDVWPGAKRVLKKETGRSILLIKDVETIINNLQYGDVVYRHMMDGDYVIFNRQPSLHKLSIMGFRTKIIHGLNSFRLNNCTTVPFNADFDGDEMNMHVVNSAQAEAEIRKILNVRNHIVNPVDSKTVISPIQDNALGAYFMTINADEEWPRYKFMQLINNARFLYISKLEKGKKTFRLIEAIELLLPEDFTMIQSGFEIRNGKWYKGILNKGSSKKVIKVMYLNYGSTVTSRFVSSLQRITDAYLSMRGYTVSINDCYVDKNIKEQVEKLVYDAQMENLRLIKRFDKGEVIIPITQTANETFELHARNIINKCERSALEILKKHLKEREEQGRPNNFPFMIKAKSKGKDENLQQILNFVGQQSVDAQRIKMTYGNRTLPHFQRYDQSLVARGFIPYSYADGLIFIGFYHLGAGARVGLIDTALRTADTGYLARKLTKLLESIVVQYDGSVRIGKKQIISHSFGGYHFDTAFLVENELSLKDMNYKEIIKKHM